MGLLTITPLKSAAGSAPFTPASISGLVEWLDASNAGSINAGSPSNGDPITTWHDLSSSANNATGTGSNTFVYTTNAINGLSAALSTVASSQSMLLGADVGPMSTFSIFIVYKPNSTARQVLLGWVGGDDAATLPDINSSGTTEIYDGLGANFTNFTQALSAGSTNILAIQSGTDASTLIYKTNNVVITPVLALGSGWNASISIIGSNASGSVLSDGYFGEIIIYNRSVNNTEATQLYNYLFAKWA